MQPADDRLELKEKRIELAPVRQQTSISEITKSKWN
jgi:hypothetical protein